MKALNAKSYTQIPYRCPNCLASFLVSRYEMNMLQQEGHVYCPKCGKGIIERVYATENPVLFDKRKVAIQ